MQLAYFLQRQKELDGEGERGRDDFYSPQDIYQPAEEIDENQEECSDDGEQ